MKFLRVLYIFLTLTILLSASFLDGRQVASASNQAQAILSPNEATSYAAQSDGRLVVRFYFADRAALDAVAGELDIWEVHHDLGYALAAVSPDQADWLRTLGYPVEIDQQKTAQLLAPTAPLDPRYYYFDPDYPNPNGNYMVEFMQTISNTYPSLVEMIDIGNAWQGEHGGYLRDIWVLRITNEDPAYGNIADKPPFFLFANIHAREVSTPEMAIRYIKYLTSGYNGMGGYGIDPDVTWLVDWHAVYILVSENPDGHRVNEANTGANRRKNMDNDDGCTTTFGVDLNRNHSFKWSCCGGSSGNPCSDTYRGPSRGSEPEIQAFQNYFATIFTDWNGSNGDDEIPPAAPDNAAGIFISLHTYSDLVLWPWGFQAADAPNGAQLQTIGRKFAYFNNYTPQQANDLYTVDGSSDDWTYGKFGVASFTFEIGPTSGSCGGFFPAYECQDGLSGYPQNFWAENRPAFIYAHKIAATPYITAYGPDTQNLNVSPASVPQGNPVNLTGNVMDHRYGGDPIYTITAAEYFIDQPGSDGAGTPMNPADGSWGGSSENIQATVNTSSLAPGTHYILVHGRNSQNKWGPFTAIFLTVTPPEAPTAGFTSNSPVALGEAMVFTNTTSGAEPLTFAWDFGDGVGTSSERNPSYTYTAVGTYTVVMTATNIGGSDSISQVVEVLEACTPLSGVELTLLTLPPLYPGLAIQFSADLMPDNADKPYTYTIDFGDNTDPITATSSADPLELAHTFETAGDFTLQFDAWNCAMVIPVGDSLNITIQEPYTPFLQVDLSLVTTGTIYVDEPVEFSADLLPDDASRPYTYTIDFGDGTVLTDTSSLDPLSLIHTYVSTGTYTVQIGAWNGGMTGPVTDAVQLTVYPTNVCIDLESIVIQGATSGNPGIYTFTTSYLPPDATLPIAYLWDDGGTSASSTRTLGAGEHTLTITATNCASALVTDTHTIVISVPTTSIYLPMMLRSSGQAMGANGVPPFETPGFGQMLLFLGPGMVILPLASRKRR